jgi:hypothetical protein
LQETRRRPGSFDAVWAQAALLSIARQRGLTLLCHKAALRSVLAASEAIVDHLGEAGEERVSAHVEGLIGVIRHAGRALPLRDCCLGLLMPAGAEAWSRWRR